MNNRQRTALFITLFALASVALISLQWRARVAQAANTNSLDLVRSSSQSATSTDTGFPTGNNAWTVEAWVKLRTNNQYGVTVGWGTEVQDSKESIDVYCGSNGNSPGKMSVYTQGSGPTSYSNTTIPTGEWHHCAVTWDGTNIRYYLDGQSDGSTVFTYAPTLNLTLTGAAHLGAMHYPGGVGDYFDGLTDEVRVWDVARTQSEIGGNMYNFDLQPSSSLVAYWKLDGDYSDTSGNDHTLNAYNSPTFSSDIPAWHGLTARKTTDQSVSSNTNPAPDNQLVLGLGALKTYIIDGVIFAKSANATPDLKFDFSATSASVLTVGYIASDGTTGNSQNLSGGALLGSQNTGTVSVGANTPIPIHISGTVVMSGSAGDMVFEWAQNTSNANAVTVMKGSYLRAQEIQ
jgi:hypothetical protein